MPHLNQILTKVRSMAASGAALAETEAQSGSGALPGTPPALFLLDLDSTLLDLTQRTYQILQSYLKEAPSGFSAQSKLLEKIEILRSDWGLREPLGRLGISGPEHQAFLDQLHIYWRERFFSNHFLNFDLPVDGAQAYIQALWNAGAEIVYLSGRDRPNMEAGTVESLKAHGFPLHVERTALDLKPHHDLDDAEFKLARVQDYQKRFHDIWLFENEPVNINLIHKNFPQINLVMMESCHSGKEAPPQKVYRIQNFRY